MSVSLTKACIDDDDVAAVQEAVRRGAIAQGGIAAQLETRFAELVGGVGSVATNSCTGALELALRVLGVGSGDEVILPSYTCLAVLHAVSYVGAAPRLTDCTYDIGRMDFNTTAELVLQRRTSRTRAVIVPHMFGVAAKIDEIMALGIPVIEDVTLSLGGRHQGRPLGAWGDLTVCSFHASKMISAGEGGMLTTRRPELLERARHLNGWQLEQAPARLEEEESGRYEARYSFRMSDMAAALCQSQLGKLSHFLARRRGLSRRYVERLSGVRGLRLPAADAEDNLFFRFLAAVDREVIPIVKSFMEAGIELGRGVYPPLHRFLGEPRTSYPGTERAAATLISIPLYPALTDAEVDELLRVSREILAKHLAS